MNILITPKCWRLNLRSLESFTYILQLVVTTQIALPGSISKLFIQIQNTWMRLLVTPRFSKLLLLVLRFTTSLCIPDQESVVWTLIFLNPGEHFASQNQNLTYMKGNMERKTMTTEQLLEEAQLEKLTYFQNSEQINSSRQYL